jgi:hypothetical protein
MEKAKYRILKADGRYLGTRQSGERGTKDSWFHLEEAAALVRRNEGEKVVEHDGIEPLWEVCVG